MAGKWASLAAFLVLVMGGGIVIGAVTAPGDWYAGLEKPAFNPPDWVFGPVWTLLYLCIAVAGWRVWHRAADSRAMALWFAQMGLNFLWSPVFFAAQRPGWAFLVILAMLLAILAFIAVTWQRDRPAALLFLPYAAWVGFAALLNGSIYALNAGS